jgi:hypothetical protein
MRNLDITDTRAKLEVYSNAGLLELGKGDDFLKLGKQTSGVGKKARAFGLFCFHRSKLPSQSSAIGNETLKSM